MANLNQEAYDWQIRFYRTGGVALGTGIAYVDILFWSAIARFFGYARLSGATTGTALGALVGSDASPWDEVPHFRAFSMNELHGISGRAEINYSPAGVGGYLDAWNRRDSQPWMFYKCGFSGVSDGSFLNSYGAGKVTISGLWQLKEVWAYED